MRTIVIGDSDEDSDWIKKVAGGKFQQEDLAASERALEIHRAGAGNVVEQLKAVTSYKVMQSGVYIGRLDFGSEITVDVRSMHPQLVQAMQQMITYSVVYQGRQVIVGQPDYEAAVLNRLTALGFTYTKL